MTVDEPSARRSAHAVVVVATAIAESLQNRPDEPPDTPDDSPASTDLAEPNATEAGCGLLMILAIAAAAIALGAYLLGGC